MKSTVRADASERLERLARLLTQQPFEPEIERRLRVKWEVLATEYERDNPGAVPPLLEFADNDGRLAVRWPRGGSR